MARTTTATLDARVYSFHCRINHEQEQLINEGLFQAHTYYNAQIDLRRAGEREYRALRAPYFPALEKLEAEMESLTEQIDELYDAAKLTDAIRAEIKDLKSRRKSLNTQAAPYRRDAKKLRAPADVALSKRVEALAKKLTKANGGSRSKSGTIGTHTKRRAKLEVVAAMLKEKKWHKFWKAAIRHECEMTDRLNALRRSIPMQPGTYLAVDAAVDRSFKDSREQGTYPKRKRFERIGKLGVQLSPGLELPETGPLQLTNDRVSISLLPAGQWETRSGRRHAYTTVRLKLSRIDLDAPASKRNEHYATQKAAADKDGNIYLEFGCLMHRRPVGTIKWAYLVARRIGNYHRYELQLTTLLPPKTQLPPSGVAAINLGWRSKPDGTLRVAYLVDDTGHEEEVLLDEHMRDRLTEHEDLRRKNDVHFNVAKEHLINWMKANKPRVSEELRESTKHIHKWRAARKLARAVPVLVTDVFGKDRSLIKRLWRYWCNERLGPKHARKPHGLKLDLFDSKENLEAWFRAHGVPNKEQTLLALYLEWWRRKNRHLYDYECGSRQGAIKARREIYRLCAHRWSNTYRTLLLGEMDLSELAERPPKGTVRSKQEKYAASNRVVASCYSLKLALFSAVSRGQLRTVAAKLFTLRCSACGTKTTHADVKESIHLSCRCGHEEDQDARFCRNVLKSRNPRRATPQRNRVA